MTLTEALKDADLMRRIVEDGVRIIDEEVQAKRGLSGKALRVGYRTIKKIKPDIIHSSLAMLLPGFAPAIDPHWDRAVASGDTDRYFRDNRDRVADDLLAVTDRRGEVARNRVMIKVYKSLRGKAKEHTAGSVHRIPELIQKYVT